MKKEPDKKQQAVRYLYGQMEGRELETFEERLFTDEDFSWFVDDVENDLIDEYVRGEFQFEEKREFERRYLTTEDRFEKVSIARTLDRQIFANKTAEQVNSVREKSLFGNFFGKFRAIPIPAFAGGLAVLLSVFLIGGFLILNSSNEIPLGIAGNIDSNKSENNESSPESLASVNTEEFSKSTETENDSDENKSSANSGKLPEADSNTPEKKENINKSGNNTEPKATQEKPEQTKKPETVLRKPSVFTASLLPPLRSSENPVLKIPDFAKTVNLQLLGNFGRVYEKFIVELSDGKGRAVWNEELQSTKKTNQKSIRASIPENLFKSGNYEIAVRGVRKNGSVEEINFYNFVVERIKRE